MDHGFQMLTQAVFKLTRLSESGNLNIVFFKVSIKDLIYSRIEVAADARRGGRSCGCPPQVLHNKADAVRSVGRLGRRLKGKFGRNFLWKTNGKSEEEKDLQDLDDLADFKEDRR
jgi:hypothetical protein